MQRYGGRARIVKRKLIGGGEDYVVQQADGAAWVDVAWAKTIGDAMRRADELFRPDAESVSVVIE